MSTVSQKCVSRNNAAQGEAKSCICLETLPSAIFSYSMRVSTVLIVDYVVASYTKIKFPL